MYAHKTSWQRQGDSLTVMTKEREQSILYENLHNDEDWSAKIIPTANLEDLDPAAIMKAMRKLQKQIS